MSNMRMRLVHRRILLRKARAKAKKAIAEQIRPLFKMQFKRLERFLRKSNLRKKLNKIDVSELVKKYNPDQPRAPKGEENGGQWTSEGVSTRQGVLNELKEFDQKVRSIGGVKDVIVYGSLVGDKPNPKDADVVVLTNKGSDASKVQEDFISRYGKDHGRVRFYFIEEAADEYNMIPWYESNTESRYGTGGKSTTVFFKASVPEVESLFKVEELFKAPSAPKPDEEQWEEWKKIFLIALLLGLFLASEDLGDIENTFWISYGKDPIEYNPERLIAEYQLRSGLPLSDIPDNMLAAVKKIIAKWYTTDEPFPTLIHDLDRFFNDSHISTIATTETGNLLAEMIFRQMEEYGISHWIWDALGENPCKKTLIVNGVAWEGCTELNGHRFPIYAPMPPRAAHPNCECLPTPDPEDDEMEKGYNPGQARVPAGDRRGGQFADQGKGTSRKKPKTEDKEKQRREKFLSKYFDKDSLAVINQHIDDVREYGLESGMENLIAFEDDGTRYSRSFGEETRCDVPQETWDKSTGTVHNHPSSGSFSGPNGDVEVFMIHKNQKIMVVVGHDNSLYVMRKPDGYKAIQFMDEGASIQEFYNNAVTKTYPNFYKTLETVKSSDIAGEMTRTKVLMPIVAEHYGFEYDYYWPGVMRDDLDKMEEQNDQNFD